MGRQFGLLVALFLAVQALSCAESPREGSPDRGEGSAALAPLGPTTLSALRDSFNSAVDRPRILVMLSPT